MLIIYSQSTSPTFNLAAEEFFFTERHDDLLFLYVNEPSVIIGCNQVILNEVNLEYCRKHGIQIARRFSGGGAVYHDLGNLNYSFITNRIEGKSPLDESFLQPVISILENLNVHVIIGKRKDLWLPDGYKVSGTASHVSKKRELHHGTLLYDVNLNQLIKSLSPINIDPNIKGIASVRSSVKNIKKYLEEHNSITTESDIFFQKIQKKFEEFYDSSISKLNKNENNFIIDIQKKHTTSDWVFKK